MTFPPPHLSHPKYRPDIDGLRAIAVLSVVAFHAFPNWLPGGFIGVDIFFVISGFLITSIIFENLEKGTFSFAEFYARRIRRIFPALILVLITSFVIGWFVLLADEYKQLGKHIAAGAGFVSNLVLWSESGYFDNAAETKPLLHLWSLGIEEQFYIVWPLLLWAVWKLGFNLLTVTIIVALVSFLLNIKGVKQDAIATFYSPQTRFWELLSGSLLAWVLLYKKGAYADMHTRLDVWLGTAIYKEAPKADGKTLSNVLSFVGLFLIAYGLWKINKQFSFPGKWALLPVMGAVLLILAGPKAWVNRTLLSNRVAIWIGLISFPLYLWHWPLLSLARIVEGGIPGGNIRIAVVVLSVGLAWLTYKLLEKPVRLGKNSKINLAISVVLMIIIGYAGYNTYRRDGLPFRSIVVKQKVIVESLDWKYWENPDCSKKFGISPCQYSGEPLGLMIVGDSHGNHLYPGLANTLKTDAGVISAGTCAPITGVKLFVNKNQAEHPCATNDYLAQNIKILDANPTIKTVILSSFWRPVLEGGFINAKEREHWGGMRVESGYPEERGLPPEEQIYLGIKRTINELKRREKEVIFVRDTPDFELDIRDICLKRFALTSYAECQLPRSMFENRRSKENQLVKKLKQDFPNLKLFDPFETFCNAESCFLSMNGKPLYRDQHHLSAYGSDLLAESLVNAYLKSMDRSVK